MAYSSVQYAIFQSLQAILQAANFDGPDPTNPSVGDINPANIRIRELPTTNETIAVTPAVLICPKGANKSDPISMEGSAGRTYRVEICAIDATEGDFATDQQKRQSWHEQVVNLVERSNGEWRMPPLPNCPTVWGFCVDEAPTFDRSKLSELYSYESVVVEYYSSE